MQVFAQLGEELRPMGFCRWDMPLDRPLLVLQADRLEAVIQPRTILLGFPPLPDVAVVLEPGQQADWLSGFCLTEVELLADYATCQTVACTPA